jgi:hypothetical protein
VELNSGMAKIHKRYMQLGVEQAMEITDTEMED